MPTPEPLTIIEILGRSEQGVTRPFLCRCDDDRLYYVKGQNAGPRSLLCEWLAGHLACALGLPLPEFAIVQAPQALVDLHAEGSDLGAAPAFGSCKVDHVQELTVSHLGDVPAAIRNDVMVFDWWVHNQDRTLTACSGNPNLLWDAAGKRLVVIDHNVAFDRDFQTAGFMEEHVFSKQIPQVFQDLAERGCYVQRLRDALAVWPVACNNAPQEWWFVDEERTVPTDFDPTAALALLNRCTNEEFWRLTP
jgi:hypothetical protein